VWRRQQQLAHIGDVTRTAAAATIAGLIKQGCGQRADPGTTLEVAVVELA